MRADKRPQPCDVTVYSDKGSLALRFPKRHSPLWEALDGKSLKGKPKCLGIGKYGYSDNPDDWKRATQLAIALEADLDHPEWEKLFDITLAKYGLGGGKYAKLADVLQLPGAAQPVPEITVGEMWEAYLEWKGTVIEETTFKVHYATMYSNAIEGKIWNNKSKAYHTSDFPLKGTPLDSDLSLFSQRIGSIKISQRKQLISALSEAFKYCVAVALLKPDTQNPFTAIDNKYAIPTQTTQDKYASQIVNGELKKWHEIQDEGLLEEDRRAFTKKERDAIIKAFYDASVSKAFYAPLIEFYFLTGCRTSEALPLTWKDIDFERNVIRFSKSLGASTLKIKKSKTGEVRLFYFHKNSQLERLLFRLKKEREGNDSNLVFPGKKGKYIQIPSICQAWLGTKKKKILKNGTEKEYHYPGIVTQLVEEGIISGYLSQYHTRHTYITLTAHANAHNNNALLHIATACGNSIDVIFRHYLGVAESVQIIEA